MSDTHMHKLISDISDISENSYENEEEEKNLYSTRSTIDEIKNMTETKVWNLMKGIPFVNIVYGTVRCLWFLHKVEWRQTFDSLFAVIGGLLGLFLILSFDISMFSSKISQHYLSILVEFTIDMILGGLTQYVIIGGGDIILIKVFEPDKFNQLSRDNFEALCYDKIFKEIPFFGAFYSLIRSVVYKVKANNEEVDKSLWAFVANACGSIVGLVLATSAHYFIEKAYNYNKPNSSSYEDDAGRIVAFIAQRRVGGTGYVAQKSLTGFKSLTQKGGKGLGRLAGTKIKSAVDKYHDKKRKDPINVNSLELMA